MIIVSTVTGSINGALTKSSKSSNGLLDIVTGSTGKLIPEKFGNGKVITSS